MEQVLTYISSHFPESLSLLLICLLFLKENIVQWIGKYFGTYPTESERRTVQMANTMEGLKLHFNDETTHILTDIQVMLAKNEEDNVAFKENNAQQCLKLEEIRDTLRDMSRNGIRIRR